VSTNQCSIKPKISNLISIAGIYSGSYLLTFIQIEHNKGTSIKFDQTTAIISLIITLAILALMIIFHKIK
jgi:hypothetical protein